MIIIWLGLGEISKLALIFIAVFPYILQMSADVARSVPRKFVAAATLLGATKAEVFWRVILRSSIPDLLSAARVNLGAAWTFLVVAELTSSGSGLGAMMGLSQRFLDMPRLFALVILIGVLGYSSDRTLGALIAYHSRWKKVIY
jgi:ABC-type nitrate/sulfonate/bicarbonate transport system permease component